MSLWLALLLGIIEGLTEFLPVSSTGHLILLGERFAGDDPAVKTIEVVIQAGAMLAVLVHYRAIWLGLALGVARRDPVQVRLVTALAVAFVPAAAVGFFFHTAIKDRLFGTVSVAIALIVGGLAMIATEAWLKRRPPPPDVGLEALTLRQAAWVGIAQCFSLWPGMSRSMTTILGGQLAGMRTPLAAQFSFLLSVPILGAATVYDLSKGYRDVLEAPGALAALVTGLVVAFVVSMLVIQGFLAYLKRFGLAPFGVYRVLLGAVVLAAAFW